ncbi:hypothetical protein GV64_07565 [Endozoicomonas elysicola]|uniref:Uncharacterized protein n=1 Tax=Endozoicomonas elysicola TaxID=305900 RepID=A0A081K8Z0_9GAMM|nr:hypothetical protein GV64_07565 [Endozoicomonas elysicola]
MLVQNQVITSNNETAELKLQLVFFQVKQTLSRRNNIYRKIENRPSKLHSNRTNTPDIIDLQACLKKKVIKGNLIINKKKFS